MRKGWKIGWKLVVEKHGRLYSFNRTLPLYDECVLYRPNRETRFYFGCGPLAVFATKEDCIEYDRVTTVLNVHIYRCEYLPAPPMTSVALWNSNYGMGCACGEDFMPKADLPPGTVLADAVVLREKVSP